MEAKMDETQWAKTEESTMLHLLKGKDKVRIQSLPDSGARRPLQTGIARRWAVSHHKQVDE